MNRIFVVTTALTLLAVMPAFGREQHADKNKPVVRRVFTEILSQGKFEITGQIYASDFVNTTPHRTWRSTSRRALIVAGVPRFPTSR